MSLISATWRDHRSKAALTTFCIFIAAFDTFFKALSPIAAGALAIAVVPWVLGLIEKISAPGGFEVVFAKVERQLDDAGATPDEKDLAAFKYFGTSDPNLAIAMLRVQIERRLRQLAEEVSLPSDQRWRPRTLPSLSGDLVRAGAISTEADALLRDLMPVMNAAVHGVDLQPNALEFALDYGPKILSMLKITDTR